MSSHPLQIDWQEEEGQLFQAYHREKHHQDRTRLQALWLLRKGHSLKEVSEVVGVHYQTLRQWVAWYREGGVDEVLCHRHGGHGGRQRKLSPRQEKALKQKASQGNFHTVWDAVRWVKEEYDISYTYWGMRWVLARLSLQ